MVTKLLNVETERKFEIKTAAYLLYKSEIVFSCFYRTVKEISFIIFPFIFIRVQDLY